MRTLIYSSRHYPALIWHSYKFNLLSQAAQKYAICSNFCFKLRSMLANLEYSHLHSLLDIKGAAIRRDRIAHEHVCSSLNGTLKGKSNDIMANVSASWGVCRLRFGVAENWYDTILSKIRHVTGSPFQRTNTK